MADALGRAAPAPMAEPPPPQPAPIVPEEAWPQPDSAAGADHYAITCPRRAALIRSLGCLPAPCTLAPPKPELVQAIVTGTSPILRTLDSPAEVSAAAD